jgi:hypothetical protein
MNRPSAIALFVSAAFLSGAAFGDLPDKKQKNPGRADAPVSRASSKQDQSHDVHELEKISFTVTDVAAAGSGAVTYLRVATPDYDDDGKLDVAYLRLVCTGGAATEVASWSWGASQTGMRSSGPPGAPKEWSPASPQLRALTASYLKKKLDRSAGKAMNADAGGWTRVTLSGGEGLCPAADGVKATKSRSNIQNN